MWELIEGGVRPTLLSKRVALCHCLVSCFEPWTEDAVAVLLGMHALGPLLAEGGLKAQRMQETRGF